MYESLTKRLAFHEGLALMGLYFCQYLMVVASPTLIILGFGIANPFIVLAGLVCLRLLFFFSDLQKEVMQEIINNDKQARIF